MMRLTVKFAHFNQRYARLTQHKMNAMRAFKLAEGQFEALASTKPRVRHETPEEAVVRVLASMARK